MKKNLTLKQRTFIDQYVLCRNGTEAARRAGYSEKTAYVIAYENLRKPRLMTALAEKEQEIAHEYQLTKRRVITEIHAAIELAKSQFDAGNIIRGWLEIAKILDLYKPEAKRVEVSPENRKLQAKMALLSDAELTEIVEGRVTI